MIPEHISNSTYIIHRILNTPKYDNSNNNPNVKISSSRNKNLNIFGNTCFRLISFVQRKGVQDSLRRRSPTYILLMFQVKTK